MSDLHHHIQSVVTLGSVTPGDIGSVLGVSFTKERESPSWEFYEAGPTGVFKKVVLNLSKTDLRWLVGWKYEFTEMPREDELDLSRYGATPKLDVNPQMPPEGTFSYVYEYMGLKLFIQFSGVSKRLYGVALHRK